MAIEIQNLPRFTFPSKSGGPQTQTLTVGFTTLPRSAGVAINGFKVGYTNADHHLFQQEIDASARILNGTQGPEVQVRVNFALRDHSGNFDDAYEGYVDTMLIVDR